MDERLKKDCMLIKLIKAARDRHNEQPISPLTGKYYVDCYSPAADNDGWHVLHYHVGIREEKTAHAIAIHDFTGEVMKEDV
jgi:hypothetical protein